MYSYAPVQNPAPQAVTPRAGRAARAATADEFPTQSRQVSARTNPAQSQGQRQSSQFDPTAGSGDHMYSYGPVQNPAGQ